MGNSKIQEIPKRNIKLQYFQGDMMASKEADKSTEEAHGREDKQKDNDPELSFGDVEKLLAMTSANNETEP